MRLDEKLHKRMQAQGLNGQKLARLSQVSDSEISRILTGKSLPGLENAFKLAKAVGVSLDFLADDSLENDPARATESGNELERALVKIANEIGLSQALMVLENVRIVGYEVAMRRLLEAKPIIEPADGSRSGSSTPAAPATGRATA